MRISRIFIEFEVDEEIVESDAKVSKVTTKKPVVRRSDRKNRRYGADEDAWLLKRGNANRSASATHRRNFGFKRSQKSLANRLSRLRVKARQE